MLASELAAVLGGRVVGDGSADIVRGVHPADACEAGDLAIAVSHESVREISGSRARMVAVCEGVDIDNDQFRTIIVLPRARDTFPALTRSLRHRVAAAPGVHPSAIVDPSAQIDPKASIGPLVVIGAGVVVGAGTVVLSHVTLSENVVIGRDCLIHPGVRIGWGCRIGDRVTIHNNASIGADGFGYVAERPGNLEAIKGAATAASEPANARNRQHKIFSLSIVEVDDDVEIGALSAIDRGTVRPTRIGPGTKIDDHVLVGHNVTIGCDCLLCGQVGIAGSATIGDGVILGGRVGIADHMKIGSHAIVGAGSGVATDIPAGSVYLGVPAVPRKQALEDLILLGRMRRMFSNKTKK
jgi:UDP-3-O-[3-hydroxymyristoyl] glucosamine N-acyltransferase